jgi:hypothetical protein
VGEVTGELVFGHIGHAQNIQLDLASATSSIDRQQDGKSDQTTDKADHRGQFEETDQEVGVHGVVL